MSIIEKLGITLHDNGIHPFKSEEIYKSVKDTAPEMLEALLDIALMEYLDFQDYYDWLAFRGKVFFVLEKATGLTSDEIRALR